VEHYFILARSVTFAQRMQKLLERNGIRCQIARAPRDMTDLGCAYTVRVAAGDLSAALAILRGTALAPVQIFSYRLGRYREVGL